jgi:LysM repeat protein
MPATTSHVRAIFALSLLTIIPLALSGCSKHVTASKQDSLKDLVAAKWSDAGVILPTATRVVQYEADLGERWIVDFESGDVILECLWLAGTSVDSPTVRECMSCAISNLYVSTPVLPDDMLDLQRASGYVPSAVPRDQLERRENTWVYTVRKGDTLSEVSRKFRVPMAHVMKANALTDPDRLSVGQTLNIPEPLPHTHLAGEEGALPAKESLLAGQIVDPKTGEAIDANNIRSFGEHVMNRNGIEREVVIGTDGVERVVSRVRLSLADKHLQIRARKYYSTVSEYAERFGHDPAVIMAMIHTESAFNPIATSPAGAYGLMQIVPSSGGREANKWLNNKDRAPSRDYLLRPSQNIELGTAYMKVLQDKVFKGVNDPHSRLYCAVAAYNGGGGNVGRTFTGRKSVNGSLDRINAKTPKQVLETLQSTAPHKETRDYVRRVFERAPLYREPNWTPSKPPQTTLFHHHDTDAEDVGSHTSDKNPIAFRKGHTHLEHTDHI